MQKLKNYSPISSYTLKHSDKTSKAVLFYDGEAFQLSLKVKDPCLVVEGKSKRIHLEHDLSHLAKNINSAKAIYSKLTKLSKDSIFFNIVSNAINKNFSLETFISDIKRLIVITNTINY